jgi:two-component system response regulator MprA
VAERILVVEDDLDIQRLLARTLSQEGYDVTTASDGARAVEVAREWRPDLIVLDVMLPELDGFAVCERVREELGVPIVMLTAKSELEDRIAGLEIGADDYIVKPFAVPELLTRLKVQLRRRQRPATLRFQDLILDLDTRVARRGEREIPLTSTEFLLLRALMERPGTVQSRTRLHDVVWSDDEDINSNLLEVYVARLRRKLEAGGELPLLHTVRGVGYVVRA